MIATQIFEQPHFSYRGRTSAPVISHPRRSAIAGLLAAVLFSTATAAAATKLHGPFNLAALGEHTLAANNGLPSFGNSFAELAW
jgi:hypothetical protein